MLLSRLYEVYQLVSYYEQDQACMVKQWNNEKPHSQYRDDPVCDPLLLSC